MNDQFHAIAEQGYGAYLAHFRSCIAAMRGKPNFCPELLVRPNGRTTPEPFCLMRVDALFGDPSAPEIIRFAAAPEDGITGSATLSNGLSVSVAGFSWEAVRLQFKSDQFKIDSLAPWLESWLDPNELKEPEDSGLHAVVHDIAWGLSEKQDWDLCIDFGSAPVSSMQELLDILRMSGIDACQISRGDYDREDA